MSPGSGAASVGIFGLFALSSMLTMTKSRSEELLICDPSGGVEVDSMFSGSVAEELARELGASPLVGT